jgi:ribosomal subunit interface protein|tara:strand:+ start:313 stop:903 length:591 start_codon:yes stop_codon:yes gene_type:complete
MHLTVEGRHINIGDALRVYAEERLQSVLDKYFGDAVTATVILARDGHLYRASVAIRLGRGMDVQAEGEAKDPYPAFDGALEHLAKQLRRYKRRLKDHRQQHAEAESQRIRQVILSGNAEDEDEPATEDDPNGMPVIVAEMETEIHSLSVSNAVMRLDLADLPILVFRNRLHGELNVIYRRTDGSIGWIDPKGNSAL